MVQRRRGDYGSVEVVVLLIRTGKLDWEVCCFRSADDGYDAMPSTSANAITAGTTGESLLGRMSLTALLLYQKF